MIFGCSVVCDVVADASASVPLYEGCSDEVYVVVAVYSVEAEYSGFD